ncbi:MAG: HAD family hydrolase [Janthinobacterium lividum]
MTRYLIWDFDGTLGFRVGGWTSALVDVLRKKAPECRATADDLRPHIQTGYPWHAPEQGYAIRTAEQWWEDLAPVFERAFTAVGIDTSLAKIFAREVQGVYANPECFELYEDTLPVLNQLSAQGWEHLILSNHIPELGTIVSHLGLTPLMTRVFNSAEMGYEKPHPLAFRGVLTLIDGAEAAWMIGDSLAADVRGAEAVGIPAILVRQYRPEAARFCADLAGVAVLLGQVNMEAERVGPA